MDFFRKLKFSFFTQNIRNYEKLPKVGMKNYLTKSL